jgi:hypothetical protein
MFATTTSSDYSDYRHDDDRVHGKMQERRKGMKILINDQI